MGLGSVIASAIGFKPERAFDTADNLIDKVSSGLDKAWYTEEERDDVVLKKAELRGKAINAVIDYAKSSQDENSVRSVARRRMANVIVAFYLLGLIVVGVVYKVDPTYSKFLFGLINTVSFAFGAVIIFYFGSHGLRGIAERVKKN